MEKSLLTANDVAGQLRIKKYTVYELIKRGELTAAKVGKQVRVFQEDIDQYLRSRKTGIPLDRTERINDEYGRNDTSLSGRTLAVQDSPVILCGQDVCLDLLVSRISAMGQGPALRSFMGCYNGLYALYHGKVTAAAAHLWDGETDTYNYPFIRRLLPGLPVGVLRLAGRMQGFYVRKGNPLKIRGWEDLARPGLSMINRERGCGTRILLDQKLRRLGIDAAGIHGYTREATSHMACANAVARGGADIACGCERGAETVADAGFIPLQLEWYDFVYRLADSGLPEIAIIISYIRDGEFKKDLEMMGGYDTSLTGHVEEF
jgi:putative molybdopterin biosynthesis protein